MVCCCCHDSINGTSETIATEVKGESALKKLQDSERGMRHPEMECFVVEVTKERAGPEVKIGLDVKHDEAVALRIKVVKADGLIHEWNMKNPDKVVKEGDRILEINQSRGSSEQLLAKIMTERKLRMVIEPSAAAAARRGETTE